MLKDRVREYTTTTGTGALTPGGAYPGFRTFASAGIVAGTTFPMLIILPSGPWETGTGTMQSNGTITRTLSDSSTGALLSLTGEAGGSISLAVIAAGQPWNRSVYTASGAIAVTDTLSILNNAAAAAMTLGAGTVDRQEILIKALGAANATVTATIDGASFTQTLGAKVAGAPGDAMKLRWSIADASWLME